MIYTQDRILRDVERVSAQLATLATDLQTCRAEARVRLKKPLAMPLEEYDSHFVNAFSCLERAKMAIRAMRPICHQADFLKKKMERKGSRR